MELLLGTAQFGYKMIRDSSTHLLNRDVIYRILLLAKEAGIRKLDWSDTYGCDWVLQENLGFEIIKKTRELNKILSGGWMYHYKKDEPRIPGVTSASVFSLDQVPLEPSEVIAPTYANFHFDNSYLRSVFNKGEMFKEGKTVKECLDYAKSQNPKGVIIGVSSITQLQQIVEEWNK